MFGGSRLFSRSGVKIEGGVMVRGSRSRAGSRFGGSRLWSR